MASVRDVSRVSTDLQKEIKGILQRDPLGPAELVDKVTARTADWDPRPDDRDIADVYWDLIDRGEIRIDGSGRLTWVGLAEKTEGQLIHLETDT